MNKLIPFILSLGGVLFDYATTTLGLTLGFREVHPSYHPLKALAVFWGVVAVLTMVLPKEKSGAILANGIAFSSYLGAVNNMLVILGIFAGLKMV